MREVARTGVDPAVPTIRFGDEGEHPSLGDADRSVRGVEGVDEWVALGEPRIRCHLGHAVDGTDRGFLAQ